MLSRTKTLKCKFLLKLLNVQEVWQWKKKKKRRRKLSHFRFRHFLALNTTKSALSWLIFLDPSSLSHILHPHWDRTWRWPLKPELLWLPESTEAGQSKHITGQQMHSDQRKAPASVKLLGFTGKLLFPVQILNRIFRHVHQGVEQKIKKKHDKYSNFHVMQSECVIYKYGPYTIWFYSCIHHTMPQSSLSCQACMWIYCWFT